MLRVPQSLRQGEEPDREVSGIHIDLKLPL
jgi:hypothetical protein